MQNLPLAENSTRQRIMDELRRLHRANKPLNLTAAKRRCPELVQAVYAAQPFWGWKSALADAGLAYAHLNTELLDYCICELCGHDAGILTFHLLKEHGATPEQYRRDHPQAEIMCETVRAGRFRAWGVIPHWEPLWSYEYALDRLKELHRQGYPLNFEWANREEKGLAQYLWHTDHAWDDCLAAIGLEPESIRKLGRARSLTRHQIIRELQARQRKKLPLAHSQVARENLRLYNAARRRFGTYEAALTAARLSPDDIRQRKRRFTPEIQALVFEELRQVASMQGRQRTTAVREMRRKYQSYVFNHLGNWSEAARAAGVPAECIMVPALYDPPRVLADLRAWKAQGGELSYSGLRNNNTSLYTGACKCFGSFAKALTAAGLPMDGHGRTRGSGPLQGRHELAEALRDWQARGHRLKDDVLVRENYQLCRSARHWHGTVAAAVKAAGLSEPDLPKNRPRLYPKERIPGLLRAWHALGHRLLISHIEKKKPGLADAIRREFGSLAAAVAAAGLEPDRRRNGSGANA